MKAPADKSPDNQRQVAAHQLVNAEAKYKFVDNRAETADLRKLQEIADNSPQTQGLAQLSAVMNSTSGRLFNHVVAMQKSKKTK